MPRVAPIKLAILNTEAAIVPESKGEFGAESIIFEFNKGVDPKVPAPNKKDIAGAKNENCRKKVKDNKTMNKIMKVNIRYLVKLCSWTLPE